MRILSIYGLLFMLGILFFSEQSKAIPPIGERKYLINKERPEAIIKIVPKNQVTEYEYLKDPILPGEALPVKKPSPVKKIAPAPKRSKPRFRESEFGLRAMKIQGRKAQPRVSFEMERIELRPVEEKPETDYWERLVESPREADL